MNEMRLKNQQNRSLRRGAGIIVPLLAISVSAAWAGGAPPLGVTITNESLSAEILGSPKTYNSLAAVCNGTDTVDVTATITPTYDADSVQNGLDGGCISCSTYDGYPVANCPSGANSVRLTTSVSTTYDQKQCSATAEDGHSSASVSLACDGPSSSTNSFTPADLKISSDDKYTVTIDADVSERRTVSTTITGAAFWSNTSCGGSDKGSTSGLSIPYGSPTQTTLNASATPATVDYYLDIEAPTATHSVVTSPVNPGGILNLDITANDGSSGQSVEVEAGYNDGADVWGNPVGTFFMPEDTNDGIVDKFIQAVGVNIDCSTAASPPAYDSLARITATSDLCGDTTAYATPDPILSTSTATFDVTDTPEVDCYSGTTGALVVAPYDGDYKSVECFTSQEKGRGSKKKIVNDFGTVHLTGTYSPGEGDSCVPVGDIVFTLPPDFVFDENGGAPPAHLYFGMAESFSYLTGLPLSGVPTPKDPYPFTYSMGVSGAWHKLTVTTDNYNFGYDCDPGMIRQGENSTLLARAHVRHIVGADPDKPQEFKVKIDSAPEASYSIMENPDGGSCVNGTFIADPT
ncbi:MAG: hypothetical protein ACU84H_11930 [Gammaproteobacteria bacterium]